MGSARCWNKRKFQERFLVQRLKSLGCWDIGFWKKVYQKAMQVELIKRGIRAELEAKIKVSYKGVVVGDYQEDLFVEDRVIVELKVAKTDNPEDEPQLPNELKASGMDQGRSFDQLRSSQGRVPSPCVLNSMTS